MAVTETVDRQRRSAQTKPSLVGKAQDETKLSLKTTEFWAMLGVIAAILIAAAVSDFAQRCSRLDTRYRRRDRLHA